MTPNEALAYLAQVSSDFARSLPPSAAMPTQQAAQEAINTLAALAQPVTDEGKPALRAVPSQE